LYVVIFGKIKRIFIILGINDHFVELNIAFI
jgi:hypothetical protein